MEENKKCLRQRWEDNECTKEERNEIELKISKRELPPFDGVDYNLNDFPKLTDEKEFKEDSIWVNKYQSDLIAIADSDYTRNVSLLLIYRQLKRIADILEKK